MPELPEAERARKTLEKVLGRRIAEVDDSDTYETRPHQPGEIASALHGHQFTTANRRGKFLWLETDDGPVLGLHLGMSGRLMIDPKQTTRWDRFAVGFDDGSRLVLRDKRRLGRAVLNPDHSHIGPDAALITRDQFRRRIGSGHAPIKARLLDQGAVAGVGNLLADEVLWQAGIAPARRTNTLSELELDRLRVELRKAIRFAIAHGGVHTLPFVKSRRSPKGCPRDGHPLERATIGGRTTYWCPVDQP
jgi:formamidopyrimidine-DNA glycosylase